MSLARLIRDMAAAGAPPEAIALAVEAIEQAAAAVDDARVAARDRQRRKRERDKSRDGHVTVTPDVTQPPSLDKESFPQTPFKEINPIPCVTPADTRARMAAIGLGIIIEGCRSLQKPARPALPRWPKDMPPPPAVSDEQWAGFIAHRKAKREPLTFRAYQLLLGKLAKHADDERPPGALVDMIVERGWLTFEPHWIRNSSSIRNGKRHHDDRPSGWAARPGMEGVEPAYLDD